MSELRYKPNMVRPDGVYNRPLLEENECTVWRSTNGKLHLTFGYRSSRDGQVHRCTVPVLLNAGPDVQGAWGLRKSGPNRWQVEPSIRIGPEDAEEWHQTPALVDVPDGEPWQS